MALSNIFREPQREITESMAGIALSAIIIYVDYVFAVWFRRLTIDLDHGCPILLGMVIGFLGLALAYLALLITHEMGEGICNFLARRGVELRPKKRFYE